VQDVPHLPLPFRNRTSATERLAYVLLLGVLGYAAALLAGGLDVPGRATALRLWTLGAAGAVAVAIPNVLLPDANAPMLQVLNWPPSRLLRYQLRPMGALWVLFALPATLLAYFATDGMGHHFWDKTAYLGQALLVLTGVMLYSFDYYTTIGRRSQAWHEGRAGQWYGTMVDEAGQGVSVPRGLVPALFATARCFVVAIVVLVASALGARMGEPLLAWGAGGLLLVVSGVKLWGHRPTYDQHFYQTNALYAEVLGAGSMAATGREPVPYDALYWVPARWRPAVWASLRQFDRRLPIGRLVALGHFALWILCAQGASVDGVAAYLLTFLAAQNAACALLVTPEAAPPSFQLSMQSVADWMGTRTFVNLRWWAPHVGSLALVALFDATYGWTWVLTWSGVAVLFAATAGIVVTLATEGQARRRFS
jgi:hypothetical protein